MTTARDLMTSDATCVGENHTLEAMAEHKVRRLPVIDGRTLVGVVTQADLATNLDEDATDDEWNGGRHGAADRGRSHPGAVPRMGHRAAHTFLRCDEGDVGPTEPCDPVTPAARSDSNTKGGREPMNIWGYCEACDRWFRRPKDRVTTWACPSCGLEPVRIENRQIAGTRAVRCHELLAASTRNGLS